MDAVLLRDKESRRLRVDFCRFLPFLLCLGLVCSVCTASAQSWQIFSSSQNIGGPADETGRQMVLDSSGNIFTLSTSGPGLVVAKRNGSGATIWKTYYAAEPSGITRTADGGVVVVGRVDRGNNPTVREILTLKFDANGVLTWARILSGVTTLANPGLRVTSTADGSIYVGATVNQDTFSDISIIKYSASGDLLWQKIEGPNPDQEICFGIAPDPSGNILVFANRNPSGVGLAVVYKYAPDGTLQWTYTPTVSGSAGNFVMDAAGACYLPLNGTTPSAVKVTPSGTQAWRASLGAGNAPLAIGLLGTNAFVCGVQTATPNSFVQKLSTSGGVAWTATHAGPAGETESLNSIGIAADGTVYASGNRIDASSSDIFTVKVGATGTLAWAVNHGTYTYTPPLIPPVPPVPPLPLVYTSLAMNSVGQPITFATINGPNSATGYDSELCVDASSGAPVALNLDDLDGSHDFVDASVTDSSGVTFALSDVMVGAGADVAVQKVAANGSLAWAHRFGTLGTDIGYALAATPDGGAVACYGVFNSGTSLWDTKVRKFDTTGAVSWTTSLDGSNHVASVTCAPDGSIYLVGQDQAVLPYRFRSAKLSSTGTVLWNNLFAGVGPADDYPFKIALDKLGNLFVCGNLWDGTRYLATVQKYNPSSGAVQWTSTYASSGAGASAFTLLPDNSGNVLIFGTDWASGGRGLIRKYDSTGTLIYNRIATDADTTSERYVSAVFDPAGNILVGGSAVRPDKNIDMLAEKFSSNGIAIWKRLYDGPAGTNDIGKLISTDALGGICVAGNVSGGVKGRDLALWRLNADGSPGWPDSGDIFTHSATIVDSGRGLSDSIGGLGADSIGGVYITGSAIGPNDTYDVRTMKFGPKFDAAFAGQTVPSTMTAGQTYYVTLQFTNTSNFAWTSGAGIELGSVNPIDNSTWGFNRLALSAGESVAPGDTKKFIGFRVFAPTTPGTYNFQWSMRHTTFGPFGQPSDNVPVVVSLATNAARYVSQTSPTSVKAGSTFNVSIRMRNVGTSTWTTGAGYGLAPILSTTNWGINVALVSTSIAPGVEKQFVITCHAPTTPGTYVFRWQMKSTAAGFFGDQTVSKTITVNP